MGDVSPIDEAISRFTQLEDIERRQTEGTQLNRELFETARKNAEAILSSLCDQPEVHNVLEAENRIYQDASEELSFLKDTGLIEGELLAQKEKELEELSSLPRIRLARRYLGSVSISGATDQESAPKLTDDSLEFFKRPPEVVANELVGKALVVKGKTCVIEKTMAQDENYNAKWAKDPIFGKDRVDVMVSPTQGNYLMYLRAGDDEHTLACVRIVGVTLDGELYSKPSRVCAALGLDEKLVGSIEMDGNIIKIVGLKPAKAGSKN